MVSLETFNSVKEKYGRQASWAIWGPFGERPRDNMDDLSIFDEPSLHSTLPQLTTEYVLVGLNISTRDIVIPLSNFHGRNGEVYKVRYALHETDLWGAYMTDILKDFRDSRADPVSRFLKTPDGPPFEKQNVESFRAELETVGAENATLIAFGKVVYDILTRHFGGKQRILKIDHYGYRINKEIYKYRVHNSLSQARAIQAASI